MSSVEDSMKKTYKTHTDDTLGSPWPMVNKKVPEFHIGDGKTHVFVLVTPFPKHGQQNFHDRSPWKWGNLPAGCDQDELRFQHGWVVVSNIFYFHPYLGKIPMLTIIFQMG